MIAKFAKPVLYLSCCALLAACDGAPASNELQLDNDGNGRFSGSAGADWSAQEIRTYASNQICGKAPVAEFRISVLPTAPEYKIISGSCASRGDGLAATGIVQTHVATTPQTSTTPVVPPVAPPVVAPVVTSVGNSAVWDGSTPFVD